MIVATIHAMETEMIEIVETYVNEAEGLSATILEDLELTAKNRYGKRYGIKVTDLDAGESVGYISFRYNTLWAAAQDAKQAICLND